MTMLNVIVAFMTNLQNLAFMKSTDDYVFRRLCQEDSLQLEGADYCRHSRVFLSTKGNLLS